MIKKTYTIKGMHCASCVTLIQNKIQKIDGVTSCEVLLASNKANIVFEDAEIGLDILNAAIKPFGYSFIDESIVIEKHHHMNMNHGENTFEKDIKIIIPMIIFSFAMMILDLLKLIPENFSDFVHHLMPIFAAFVLFGIGRKYIKAVWIFLKTRTANMDTLVGISTVIAFLYSFAISAFEKQLAPYLDVNSNFYDVVVVVIGLIAIGQSLEAKARQKTNEALRKLAELSSKFATIERNGKEIEIAIDQIHIGDIVIVKPNEKIPVDGIIVFGHSSIDESNLTGESIPNDKTVDDKVFSGTQNFQGLLKVRVDKDNKDTALSQIIKIVENAQNSKAPIERLADKISGVFVYVVIVLAFLTFVLWMIFGLESLGLSKAIALGISATMAVLVIACPCSLGLATPTAIITGVGTGARRGILIKNAESLEKLSKVDVIVFDKTGTLTENKLSIEGVFHREEKNNESKDSIIYSLAKSSKHPISHSVATWLQSQKTKETALDSMIEIPGKGMKGFFEYKEYYLGSLSYATEITGISFKNIFTYFDPSKFESGRELYFFNKDGIISLIKIHDTIKSTAKTEIAKLKKLGLKVVMATGDHKKTGESVGKDLGIDEVFTDVKPEGKLDIVKKFQSQGLKVAMIGDGVNDTPALAQANVAISMSDGSDIAIESSDIVLLHGNIEKVAEAFSLAKKTNRIIWQNLIWSFGYNTAGIPIAAGILFPLYGFMLSPAVAGAIMAFESITVVLNSLRLKNIKL